MVLQFRLKRERSWRDYPGKSRLKKSLASYDFRLLSSNRKKVLVEKGNYAEVMKRFRQIEFFKHRR